MIDQRVGLAAEKQQNKAMKVRGRRRKSATQYIASTSGLSPSIH
jgi:hypothetical protein